jgi:NADH:ubiquinone oxidoreductase subunit 5 (subunit L)/multisubunit Na+/H+ antiporter MnhA subunit
MPQTATLFLIAALAICGLPPFNGFISEFLIYSGLFNGIHFNLLTTTLIMIVSIFGLVIIGGLAMLCFTKAFGIIFLGQERHPHHQPIHEAEFSKLFPKYLIVLFIISIGVFPQLFIGAIAKPVGLFTCEMIPDSKCPPFVWRGVGGVVDMLQNVSIAVCGFILLLIIIFLIRKMVTSSKEISMAPTWGCGYPVVTSKFQYTANSFVRSFRKLIRPMLMMNKKEEAMTGVFPNQIHSETRPYDKMEAIFIDIPVKHLRAFLGRFKFLQNGNPQFYVIYGVVFILLVITIPLIVDGTFYVIELFKKI